MRKLLVAWMMVPSLALAEGPPAPAQSDGADLARAERRMRLARTLGLAEALDLDTAAALKLGDQLAKFDDRRKGIRKQAAEARDTLRAAAQGGGKASAGDVDAAIAKLLDARARMQALDREMLQAITRDLTPEQKARAALFLGTFRDRVERRMMPFHHSPGPDERDGRHMRGPRGGMMRGGAADPRTARVPDVWDGPASDAMPPFADDLGED